MGRKRQIANLGKVWKEKCGKVYEHECYVKECENIMDAHNFRIERIAKVPICSECNGDPSSKEVKTEFKTKSVSSEEYSIEDPPKKKSILSFWR